MLRHLFFIATVFFTQLCFADPGYRAIYDISLAEDVRANYRQLASGKPDTAKFPSHFRNHFENRYHISLTLTVLAEEANYRLWRGDISVKSISLKQDKEEDQRRAYIFRQSVAEPFYFKVAASGKIYAIESRENVAASYVNFLRDLLSQLQIVVPDNGSTGPSWTINQEYPDGAYRLGYEPGKDENSFIKTIVGSGSADSVTAWENSVYRSAKSLLAGKLFFHKKFYQKLGTSTLAYVERTMEAEIVKEETNNEHLNEYITAYRDRSVRRAVSNIYNPVSEERRKQLVSQGVLKKDTYETLITQLTTASHLDNENLNLLISKFRSLLFLQPQYIQPVLDRVMQSSIEESSFTILVAALIEVDSGPAQDALATLINKHANNWRVLQRILPALGLRKYLSGALEKALLALRLQSNDAMIAGSAGLAISNLCRNIGEEQPARADGIMDKLVRDYMKRLKDKAVISRFLNETGNAGYDRVMEENKKYLLHEDIDIRLRAWYSFRLFKDASVDSTLNKGLFNDTTSFVQQRILTLIHMRPVSPAYKDGVLHVLNISTNEQSIELALIWLEKYVNRNYRELPRIREQMKLLGNRSIEEKFNQRLGGSKNQ